MKVCLHCNNNFTITAEDIKFLEEISLVFNNQKYLIPEPTLCPDCRAQRRMSWRNERKFHHRKCDLCQKKILSMYKPDTKFPVYCLECWWSDNWDPKKYAQDLPAGRQGYDFSQPFFKQFFELRDKTPHFCLANLASTMENSDFCNHAGYLKNCYLLVNSDQSEQCMYGKGVNRCFNCLDCFKIYDCQSCYECINCNNCAFSTYLLDSYTCDNCHFSSNLIGCKSCFGCVNLRNKEYYFANQKVSPKEYQEKITQIKAIRNLQKIWKKFQEFRSQNIIRWMQEKNTENCTGEYLVNCKNCANCFDSEYLEECKYCNDLKKGDKVSYKNMDISYFGMGVDYSYECSVSGYKANHTLFCENVWGCHDIYYSQLCVNNCHDLFGCIGMKHSQYCILNKQYSKEEYEKLASKIIGQMGGKPSARREGAASEESSFASSERRELTNNSFGEFFPIKYSAFSYNETTAYEYFPITKNEAIKNNWNWTDEKRSDYLNIKEKIPAKNLPYDINEVTDDILNSAIECEESNRLFKIQQAELNFYRIMKLPLPHLHPDVRHFHRLALRRPHKLYERTCVKCNQKITSSYSPDRPEKVYCEKCYLEAVI